ncbi:MAG: Deoxyguanosinetriphosphate triphosphohydrolase-like protein [Candidatus Lokiarchaeum sp. GC14_75]|nr:MAG: Deoxyguanosinetriphosphate triphosphohydrolase-like protein [Candidatus Lokiarchaeum sp. GC14_75]
MDKRIIEQLQTRMKRDVNVGIHGILDSEAIRFYEEESEDIRPPFFRDVDRIVHSRAYARYIDKSQVFFEINNANITHRSLHVTIVSRIARQIGRVLRLNTDLIEAIALGHDIGHAPYGHLGEEILNEISKDYDMGTFIHNAQGIRWLSYLEKRFPEKPAQGLNLSLQVLDGILCHDGEVNEQKLKPIKRNGKTLDEHIKEYDDCFKENKIKRIPMTYEGIVARFADTISYIGRDIEDAILLKLVDRKQLPESCVDVLGNTNARIINTLITDLLKYSLDNDVIGYSDVTFQALKELKTFNYENIYTRRDTKAVSYETFVKRLKSNFELIFTSCLNDLEGNNYESPIFRDHIEYIDDINYSTYFKPLKESKQLTLIVRDYIAGMSDKYFREIFELFN